MNLKKLVKRAGIHVDEFAAFCGVSRVAVHGWFNGGTINVLRKPRIDKLMQAIQSAIDSGDLPIERPNCRKVEKADVTAKIRVIIIKHLKLVAEAD